MRERYTVTVTAVSDVKTVPGSGSPAQLRALLGALLDDSTDDVSDAELADMVQMSLQDYPASEAARRVLDVVFADVLTPGQRQSLAEDWDDHPAWEHYTDMTLHLRLFEAGIALQAAFPKAFEKPHAVRVTFEMAPSDADARALLDEPSPAFAARLLGPCAPNGILYRLFDEALDGQHFPEAASVVWHLDAQGEQWTIHGSRHWLGAYEVGQSATMKAGPDLPDA